MSRKTQPASTTVVEYNLYHFYPNFVEFTSVSQTKSEMFSFGWFLMVFCPLAVTNDALSLNLSAAKKNILVIQVNIGAKANAEKGITKMVCRNETGSKILVLKNCAELYKAGYNESGVYNIDPDGKGKFKVFCDQKTAGGGWTVFQKRQDGSVNFYRGWKEYKKGFGDPKGEFWLGLDKIHRLTKRGQNRLRVELEDTKGKTAYADYKKFAVSDERHKYKLSVGSYSGTAGNSLSHHNGKSFSTKDRDNDMRPHHSCAIWYKGAWWYGYCHSSNLNGRYLRGRHNSYADGVNWKTWKGYHYSAKRAEMKTRPV